MTDSRFLTGVLVLMVMVSRTCFATSHHEDGHEVRVSPDSQGGHRPSNDNHFSTSKMDDGELDPPVTFVSETTASTPQEAVPSTSPAVPSTTHKADAKKDPRKKAKPTTLKKKDKSAEPSISESVVESMDTTTDAVHEKTETMTPVPMTTHTDGDGMSLMTTTTTVPTTTIGESTSSVDVHTTSSADLHTTSSVDVRTTLRDVDATTTTAHVIPTEHTTLDYSTILADVRETETTTTSHVPTTVTDKDVPHVDTTEKSTTTEDVEDSVVRDENDDGNGLSNDLEDVQRTTTVSTVHDLEVSGGVRKQKQLTDVKCPCEETDPLDPSDCEGGRTVADPTCPCRQVCTRQKGRPCSLGEPCDEEFGLHCNIQNNTCTGQLSIRIFDVTHDSAKITWGMSESELQPQALVSYSTVYRGTHTHWTKVQDIKPVITLDKLLPDQDYFLKVEEDGKQEIATFRTKAADAVHNSMPKILVKQRSPSSLTVVWDDFRLPSYHSEYVLEYRPASESGNWTKVQAGSQTIVTVSRLEPNTPYLVKVAVWEDDKLELPSEVITARTADGCVRGNRTYGVGDEFFMGCDFRCLCRGDNASDCSSRCAPPYVQIGSKTDDPQCYERVLPSDPCCVTIRCTESKALEDLEDAKNKSGECPEILDNESASCLSDCDHDKDCSGPLKCCPSSCGGAVCAKPVLPQDVCEHVYCGPNAECVSSLTACVCSEGYHGDPHDVLSGCLPIPVNASSYVHEDNDTRSADEDSGNELPSDDAKKEGSEEPRTDAPFELDLTRGSNGTVTGDDVPDGSTPPLFDGCEFGNVTYEKGARFEDGCDALCVCEGRGHVSCAPRCSALSAGGPACREVPDPDDPCCRIMLCTFPGDDPEKRPEALSMKLVSVQAQNGTTVRIRFTIMVPHPPDFEVWFRESASAPSQWRRRPVNREQLTEVQPGVFELDVDGLTPQTDYYVKMGRKDGQFSNTVNVKTFPAAVKSAIDGCFHHNRTYSVGEVFDEGCEHRCVCRERGFVECRDRCAIYIDAVGYEGCDWVASEEDPCCTVPVCGTNRRKKIPLIVDPAHPPMGGVDTVGFCVVGGGEVYRVGDIWESADDGCGSTRICRCARLANGSTTVQCQSECPPLPPNAHLPSPGCPRPVLVKPDDGPCRCPYVMCDEPPRRTVVPQCEFKGERYDVGHEFYDGCVAVCHCGRDLRVNCAAVECPYHFGAEFTNCLEWDIDPEFFPVPPKCCAPATCKNDGSCMFGGRKFQNFEDIPAELLPCGARCVCVNGNVTCENRCPPVGDAPPSSLPCPPHRAHRIRPEGGGEDCCPRWICREEPERQQQAPSPNCLFQGNRYRVGEKWEVQKGSRQRTCVCLHRTGARGPEAECRGGCPQIPQRFLLPTEQCLRPVVVTPEDPLMCPYVVCNNTVSGQELYNVNVVALNSTAVRIRFSLSSILVGLIGHAELHFTADPTLPAGQWHVQKFSRPKRLFDSPNIEYVLNALRPNTTYFLKVKIEIDALQGSGPESELFKLKMPPSETPSILPTTTTSSTTVTTTTTTSTTTDPPELMIDAGLESRPVDSRTVRVSWRDIDPREKRLVYALQLKYKEAKGADPWTTTPMIHRDVTSYFLHDLRPGTRYLLDLLFTAPAEVPTRIMSTKTLEFETPPEKKEESQEDYPLRVSVEPDQAGTGGTASFRLSGIPDPLPAHVHVIKIAYRPADEQQRSSGGYSFKVPTADRLVTLDHLKPGKRYMAQLELYLTNGRTLTSDEVEFVTRTETHNASENAIEHGSKQAELLLQSSTSNSASSNSEDEDRAYFAALVAVAVVAAVAGLGFVLLLILLVRRQASAKAPISRTPSESAYDNPTYKTYDGERPEDKTNGQTLQTTQA